MSTTLLASMAIPALVIILFILARIASRLYDIHKDLCRTNEYLAQFHVKETLVQYFAKETKPAKKRIYWRDENGFRRWRKNA